MSDPVAQHPRETVALVQSYLGALEGDDPAAADGYFSDDLVYIAPGHNRLGGIRRGPTAAAEWFGQMAELSGGTYGITAPIDWLASDDCCVLIAEEHGTVDGREHAWTRAVAFTVANSQFNWIELFEDDQHAYDEWLGGPASDAFTVHEPVAPEGPPHMSGDLDDPRVRAVLSYQRQVATGDLEHARAVFWPDVTYTVPGRNLLSGTMNGPDEVMGYFARLYELTEGTYAISQMHWLTSPDRVGLLTRNYASRNGRSLTWDELIVFKFVDGRKKSIAHFSGDQHGVDALLS
jgi:ketosteroid isomerase-like protein